MYNLSSSCLIILIRLCTFESEYKILVSSANKINLRSFDTLQMSLIYKINSFGPSTEPCGTPHEICIKSDEHSPILTNCFYQISSF